MFRLVLFVVPAVPITTSWANIVSRSGSLHVILISIWSAGLSFISYCCMICCACMNVESEPWKYTIFLVETQLVISRTSATIVMSAVIFFIEMLL